MSFYISPKRKQISRFYDEWALMWLNVRDVYELSDQDVAEMSFEKFNEIALTYKATLVTRTLFIGVRGVANYYKEQFRINEDTATWD